MSALALARSRARRFREISAEEGLARALGRAAAVLLGRAAGELARTGAEPVLPIGYPLGGTWQALARAGGFHAARLPPRPAPRIVVIGVARVIQSRKYRAEALPELWPGAVVRFFDQDDAVAAATALQDATHLVFSRAHRTAGTAMLLYEARRLSLPVLYDIDDPLMSLPACQGYKAMAALPARARAGLLRAAPAVLELMSAADAVSTSTPALSREVARLCPRPVWLRRNFADAAMLTLGARLAARPRRPGPLRLALPTGSAGRGPDLAPLWPALAGFLADRPETELSVIGPLRPRDLPGPMAGRARFTPFLPYDLYLKALAGADAVLIPLADDPFNRCKSAARTLDAFACARPVIASDVGEAAELIRPGETGYLARTTGDWAEALDRISDPARSAPMGEAARRDLEARRTAGSDNIADPALLAWGRT